MRIGHHVAAVAYGSWSLMGRGADNGVSDMLKKHIEVLLARNKVCLSLLLDATSFRTHVCCKTFPIIHVLICEDAGEKSHVNNLSSPPACRACELMHPCTSNVYTLCPKPSSYASVSLCVILSLMPTCNPLYCAWRCMYKIAHAVSGVCYNHYAIEEGMGDQQEARSATSVFACYVAMS